MRFRYHPKPSTLSALVQHRERLLNRGRRCTAGGSNNNGQLYFLFTCFLSRRTKAERTEYKSTMAAFGGKPVDNVLSPRPPVGI